ncbi:hypothetical protein FX988_04326 (plasmid) [Paraglaciecola mesophila]|uniref:Uncharacterized protein n=1 Tax=Paraglaciecola mesophila TaxID=197222 RepID=A0A857JTH1_9ALTE|nr:hypothetical protein [Paraglaciecola mesophila]QHJ14044.1 hypothetical protein FX988_04326 [Paraglaciecola mesophila]
MDKDDIKQLIKICAKGVPVADLGLDSLDFISNSIQKRRLSRIKKFLRYLNFQFERLTPQQIDNFSKLIHTSECEEVLSEYAESAMSTSCDLAIASTAILYAENSDNCLLSVDEEKIFPFGLHKIDRQLLDLFLAFMQMPKDLKRHCFADDESLFCERLAVNPLTSDYFQHKGFDLESCFILSDDLIRRRFLAKDPRSMPRAMGSSAHWEFAVGSTSISKKFSDIVKRATDLLELARERRLIE